MAMMVWFRKICALSAALPALAAGSPGPAAAADPIADFYSGKTVAMLIGFSPGGGYDIYARTLARHMGRHIPGNPRLVPQNMPGAGSLKVVNYLYTVAPKDGTALAHFAPGVMFEPLLGHGDGAQFEATKFTWLGSASREASVCAFMTGAGIKTWQDMRTKSYVLGASGGGRKAMSSPPSCATCSTSRSRS
jgi:tripartite-type tricarboxylate transporter receptor subunit TctC